MSGNPKPISEQNNFNPPPDPVDPMTGALKFVLLANLWPQSLQKENS